MSSKICVLSNNMMQNLQNGGRQALKFNTGLNYITDRVLYEDGYKLTIKDFV